MSAFEVNLTPSRLKNNKRAEGREPTSVVMAPFSSKAIVTFEDVPVSKTAKRILKIYNPSEDPIEVEVTKTIRPEHNVTIEWMKNTVPGNEEIEMEMVWNPLMEIACKETLQLTDNRNFRKDIMVILKSKSNKPAVKNVKRFPTISSAPGRGKTLKIKSPTNNAKASTQQRRLRQSPNYKAQKAERLSPLPKKNQLQKKQTSPLVERNIPEIVFHQPLSSKNSTRSRASSHAAKENVSPLTPGNMLDLIDKMQFTPVDVLSATKRIPSTDLEYLSSLPTPINGNSMCNLADETNLIRQIRPRRLTVAVDSSEDEMSPLHKKGDGAASLFNVVASKCELDGKLTVLQPGVINNKTFDFKQLDKSDSLSESQESFESACDRIVLNKTSTITPAISRPLSMIEEEAASPPNILQKTYEIAKADEQLKRDVKLVGTPLRKYSESMKDLSLKSPSSKISTQGSMPNLNEMENLRSIEQNRYYHAPKITSTTEKCKLEQKVICLDDSDASNSSLVSYMSQTELLFNHSEILAQSSRFNLNEVGKKSRRTTPEKSVPTNNRKVTPTKFGRKLLESPVKGTGNKRFRDISLTESPGNDTSVTETKPTVITVSPPKRAKIESDHFARSSGTLSGNKWGHVDVKKPKLARTLSLVKKPMTPRKIKQEPIVKLYDSELYLQSFINPDPFAATTTRDPFLASTMYLDERAVEKHQIAFRKWLNALVSIPADLDADCNQKIDVGRLFNEVRNKDLILAPTKEEQSMNYLTKFRLENLRQEAIRFFMSEEMQVPCSKVAVYVHKNAIRIRTDRNLHLDVVMQRYILELLLCFNPLWLRLGLEVVFAEKIHLHSCSDIVGLSTFIVNRLFKDKFLEQKYSKAYTLSDEYAEHIKKFTLQKVLFLLLFLDKAKTKRIIKHNPCLFMKKSPYKEPKEILLKFSCELLANVGDITRDLRRLGYVLTHKQNFLDEFDYAFNNLAVDLRDGIRLSRVMEIILLRDDLSKQLRVPAISRLQRVFNVNLSLRALSEANFELKGEIAAADIVDGHREKTLSLLWQIIYKFRSPKFHAAATTIQKWWRNHWLEVCIRRRIRQKIEKRRNAAAVVIQSAFRGFISRKFVDVYRTERSTAAVCIQKHIRRYLAQKRFAHVVRRIVLIQRWYRAIKFGAAVRHCFVDFRARVVFIQRWVRRVRFAKKLEQAAPIIAAIKVEARIRHEKAVVIQKFLKSVTICSKFRKLVLETVGVVRATKLEYRSAAKIQSFCRMISLRREFLVKRRAACRIQEMWRSYRQMQVVRKHYLLQRQSAITIQQRYRAYLLMKKQRLGYLELRSTVIKLQERLRANKLCHIERERFLKVRSHAICIQRRLRAKLLMRVIRTQYQKERAAIIRCQQLYRAKLAMRQQIAEYAKLKSSAICIQRFYRGRLQMKKDRAAFKRTREAVVVIQQKLRATTLARKVLAEYTRTCYYTICIQQRYRATRQMRIDRHEFLQKRAFVIKMQRRVRATQQMKVERRRFLQQRSAALVIQRRLRAHNQMRLDRAKFCGTRLAVLYIQQRFREYLCMKNIRNEFLSKRKAAICIQRRFRALQAMRTLRHQFEELRRNADRIQRRWRARQEMKVARANYENVRRIVISVQRRFKAKLEARQTRCEFERQRAAIIAIQRRFRANQEMKLARKSYLVHRDMIVRIQRRFRSYKQMQEQRQLYFHQKRSVLVIQRWYRSILAMRSQRASYELAVQRITTIQCRWRATLLARKERSEYLRIQRAAVHIQAHWRLTLAMRQQKDAYQTLRKSAVVLQRRYRARLEMLKMRSQFLLIKSLVICIQRKFRATKAMQIERQRFLELRKAVVFIQQTFRGRIQARREQEKFIQVKKVTLGLQACARGYLARKRFSEQMTPEMKQVRAEKAAARVIQRFWRGYRVRKRWQGVRIRVIRENIKKLKTTTNVLNTIRWKVQDSVRILRGRFSASDALYVLSRLERMSRTVPHLLMDHSDFISTFCYGIMAQAIRSEVDKQLIQLCSRIILNLSRYNSTTANTFQEGGLVTIAQMLLRWCDKDCDIFNTLCTLIWVFSHCPVKKQKIREFMTTAEAIYLVRETKKLVARKENMKKNIRKPVPSSLVRNQQQGNVFSNKALPSLEPDYGVIHNKPYIFISSVFAFDTILSKLNIDIHYC